MTVVMQDDVLLNFKGMVENQDKYSKETNNVLFTFLKHVMRNQTGLKKLEQHGIYKAMLNQTANNNLITKQVDKNFKFIQ